MAPRSRTSTIALLLVALSLPGVALAQGSRAPPRGGKPSDPTAPGSPGAPERPPPLPEPAPRTFDVRVTAKGFEPAEITVQVGDRVRLVFVRETDDTCATTIVMDEFLVWNKLGLKERLSTTFTTGRVGEFPYTCPTREIQGVLKVVEKR